ncbi:uncharacterized protein LACBIDRAFT_302310 [Laccaria bicolor S238N-H82]|uniref:Predicted protein n=1 Tax=Laccaria bicolor (strain S238N-H82 / ATCC MYA-4686) TaxID=486041 RepID=B0DHI3_LACBS|nr:uncharacterized protein LACBIDRAFT_302310 [Laccaria bicolor S238N-H82]EDR06109.1 predicted protein [Laccaria bicolor S238N-H82]|eukprot:XP_001883397.1 predicted protein [Laccaria bicolor S238N-H82]
MRHSRLLCPITSTTLNAVPTTCSYPIPSYYPTNTPSSSSSRQPQNPLLYPYPYPRNPPPPPPPPPSTEFFV